jgi:hypothetical protein
VNNLVCECKVDTLVEFIRAGSSAASGSLRSVVQNNIFYRNGVKHDIASVSPKGAAVGLIFDHNLINESGERCRMDDVAMSLKELSAHGFQTHGVLAPPKFRDPAANDYRPAPGSPVIDGGADLTTLVPADFEGVSRPRGKAFDIGPFERSQP